MASATLGGVGGSIRIRISLMRVLRSCRLAHRTLLFSSCSNRCSSVRGYILFPRIYQLFFEKGESQLMPVGYSVVAKVSSMK